MAEHTLPVTRAAETLSEASISKGLSRVLVRVEYQERLNPDRLQMPERLTSLAKHPVYATLSDEQRWKLSVLETVNFFSLNIHGERTLVRELVRRLYQPTELGDPAAIGEYLQHFIHEENAHTFMLAGYCNRYWRGLMPDLAVTVALPELSPLGEDLLFFARTLVLESFLDFLNVEVMKDDSLDVTARTLHRLHHLEETRHMAFDKSVVRQASALLAERGRHDELALVAELAEKYAEYAVKRLYNPSVYKEIGLKDVVNLAWEAENMSAASGLHDEWLRAGRSFLESVGLRSPEGALT